MRATSLASAAIKEDTMKKIIRRVIKIIGIALLAALAGVLLWRALYGRALFAKNDPLPRVEMSYPDALADGKITHEEIAVHYAPQIDAAVNVLLSRGGRGDFITAVDYDGDWDCRNNWENLGKHPLNAVVYYSVQETDTHYFAGYYFYHPRDDAEIWLDRHENDLEGVMLAIPKSAEGFLPPVYMYTQGHGLLPFYYDAENPIAEGSRKAGGLLLNGDSPCIYITPNGTLDYAGHSVESALDHSTYWSVGISGVRYVHGGMAQEPKHWNGSFTAEANRCSYELRPLTELWERRDDGVTFGEYAAFAGDNWGVNKANPPWGWRNKTVYGFGGSFLSDPVWTFNRAITGANLSASYVDNFFAEWKITFTAAQIPQTADAAACTLHLFRDGWEFSNPAWFQLNEMKPGYYAIKLCDEGRNTLWVAAPKGGSWRMEVRDASGKTVLGSAVAFKAEYIGQ